MTREGPQATALGLVLVLLALTLIGTGVMSRAWRAVTGP